MSGCGSETGHQSAVIRAKSKSGFIFPYPVTCNASVKILRVPAVVAKRLSPNPLLILRRIDLDQMVCDTGIYLFPTSETVCAAADDLACAQSRQVQQRGCGSLSWSSQCLVLSIHFKEACFDEELLSSSTLRLSCAPAWDWVLLEQISCFSPCLALEQ